MPNERLVASPPRELVCGTSARPFEPSRTVALLVKLAKSPRVTPRSTRAASVAKGGAPTRESPPSSEEQAVAKNGAAKPKTRLANKPLRNAVCIASSPSRPSELLDKAYVCPA
jgi:hypothetical protein